MIKVNTEQLISTAERLTLLVNRIQETEDQLRRIQNGLRESGTEFEKHISAIDRQHRKVEEERLTLKRLTGILESAAEQYAECERKNAARESTGTESGSSEKSKSGEEKGTFEDFLNSIDSKKFFNELFEREHGRGIIYFPWVKWLPVVIIPGWKPKPVPHPHPKPEVRPGRDHRPGHGPHGPERRPRRPEPKPRPELEGWFETPPNVMLLTQIVGQEEITSTYRANISDLVK